MDPLVVVGIIAPVMGLAGVFVGLSLAEYFAIKREERADRRQTERERRDRLRTRRLRSIDHTRRATSASLTRLVAVLAGDTHAHEIPIGDHLYPDVDLSLINDPDVLRLFIRLSTDLVNRPLDAALVRKYTDQTSLVQVAIKRLLDAQVERVEADEDPIRLDLTTLGSDVADGIARMVGAQTHESPPEPER